MPHATERDLVLAEIDRQIADLEVIKLSPEAGRLIPLREAVSWEIRRLCAVRLEFARVLGSRALTHRGIGVS